MRVWLPFVGFVDTEEYVDILLTAEVAVLTLRDGELCTLLGRRTEPPFRGAWSLPVAPVTVDADLETTAITALAHQGLTTQEVELHQLRTYSHPGQSPVSRRISTLYLGVGADLQPCPRTGRDAVAMRWVPLPVALSASFRLAFDHARLLADAVEHLAQQLTASAIGLRLVPEEFTVAELRQVYEIVWDTDLDPRNFHRKMTGAPELLVDTGATTTRGGGRPATLYRAGRADRINPALSRERS